MKSVLLSAPIYLWSIQVFAQTDLEELGRKYFTAWSATQSPKATARIREGMLYYLGAHVSYTAQLNHIIPAHNAIAISYTTTSKGIHPQTKELIELEYQTLEMLEIEDAKVAVIRKYEE